MKIIMGSENAVKLLNKIGCKKDFMNSTRDCFELLKKPEWFRDSLVKEIISEIDNADVEKDFSVVSRDTHTGYSVNDLSGGAKSLILNLMYPDFVYLSNMGDNCNDLMEKVALRREEQGDELILVANYLNQYNFKYIDKITYVNWDIECRSLKVLNSEINDLWVESNRKFWSLSRK